jgi:hypothetical protein
MTDQPSVHAWLHAQLAGGAFHHRDHLRLTWLVIDQHGPDQAGNVVAGLLRQAAQLHGQADRYHDTMTRFWVRLVVHVRERRPDLADLEAAIAELPFLLDKELPFRHWTRAAMLSAEARQGWLEPDVLPLAL